MGSTRSASGAAKPKLCKRSAPTRSATSRIDAATRQGSSSTKPSVPKPFCGSFHRSPMSVTTLAIELRPLARSSSCSGQACAVAALRSSDEPSRRPLPQRAIKSRLRCRRAAAEPRLEQHPTDGVAIGIRPLRCVEYASLRVHDSTHPRSALLPTRSSTRFSDVPRCSFWTNQSHDGDHAAVSTDAEADLSPARGLSRPELVSV